MDSTTAAYKRLKIAIVILCVAIMVVIVGVIGVFAAPSQSINSSFNIEYSVGGNIAAKVKTQHTVGATTIVATKDASGNVITDKDGYVVFNASDTSASKVVAIGDIPIDPKNTEVEMMFTFENISDSNDFYILFQENISNVKNVKITVSSIKTPSADTSSWADASAWTEEAEIENVTTTNWYNVTTLGAGLKTAYKVKIKVDNVNWSASCTGGFSLLLSEEDPVVA
ncbi:MAG: hypothetical protein J6A28_00280 [Clostridia bacterium]|nr:hypothetical protein [Clostridia bacterium]